MTDATSHPVDLARQAYAAYHLTREAHSIYGTMIVTGFRLTVAEGEDGSIGHFASLEGAAKSALPPHDRAAIIELIRHGLLAHDGTSSGVLYYRAIPPTPRLDYTVGEHTLVLKDGQSIPNPTRTHHRIYGPCTIYYRVYEDGGLDLVEVTEPAQPIGDGERAMFQRADDYGFDVSKIERAPDGGLWYDGSLPLDDALAQEEDAQEEERA